MAIETTWERASVGNIERVAAWANGADRSLARNVIGIAANVSGVTHGRRRLHRDKTVAAGVWETRRRQLEKQTIGIRFWLR
jgi:hypothetical protein